ncbi:MAG: aspartate aminotransferase family protein [Treponema sp.]|jgi:acetylornithine/N-succinyldiaminopimelate aminotransferase|nr:aspartate aminotransferase family protein [Treponema sp.]
MLNRDVFINTYHRLPVVFNRGQGVYLFDVDSKRYLDFTSGIAVNCLGHNYPPLVKAITAQAAKLIHVSNYFQSDTSAAFAQRLVRAANMEKVFFCNSGAEANEGACKTARKYSLKKYGSGRHTIVTLTGSFHGRTITMQSASGQDKLHKNFGPFTQGFRHIPSGDIEALDRALDGSTAGLFIEPIQGESGVFPQTQAFIAAAAQLCVERDVLLMFDEVQCGMGRTGSFLMAHDYRVKPDIITLAKGLAGGVPIGAVLVGEKTADVLGVGDHGSTFGGNPLAAAAGLAVLETVDNQAFLKEIARKGEKIMTAVRSWNKSSVKEVRGKGLMIGIETDRDVQDIITACLKEGLLVLSAGKNVLRLLPPYIITDEEIDAGLSVLWKLL